MLPLILSVVVVELFYDPKMLKHVSKNILANLQVAIYRSVSEVDGVLEHILEVAGITVVYISVCVALIAYFCSDTSRLCMCSCKKAAIRNAGFLTFLLFFASVYLLSYCDLVIYKVTYHLLRDVYAKAETIVGVGKSMVSTIGCIPRYLIFIILPMIFGVFTVCAGSCHAITMTERVRAKEIQAGSALNSLLHGLMAMSIVLVLSTILVVTNWQIPMPLFGSSGNRLEPFVRISQATSVFWGAVFTSTIIAVYGPQMIRLTQVANQDLRYIVNSEFGNIGTIRTTVKGVETVVSIIGPLLAAGLSVLIS